MRGARWLLLAAIVAILGSVAVTYQRQRREVETQAPAKPAPLPEKVQGTMADWHWKKSTPGRTEVEIWAKQFRAEPDEFQLEGVRLHIFQKDGGQYHRFESASAVFNPSQDQIFSEGAVTITLGVPIKGEAKRQLVSIRTSGVTFEGKRGLASTDRVAEFVFENGTGKSTGAAYDVNSRELQMRGNVALNWKAPGRKAMHLEAGALIYREAVSHIFLFPWAKLQRDNGSLTGGDTLVHLNEGVIQTIETQKASGADRYPRREVEYAADRLTVNFNDSGEAEKIIGEGQARLVSTSETARTTMTSDRVDLDFETADGEQALKTAIARGHGVVETAPLPGKTADPPPQTRVLHSEVIEMQMRPGGREISTVATHTPGRIEFLAGRPGQRRREMKGDRLWITYGAGNVIQSFRAVEAETRTDPPSGQPKAAPSQTWSKNLVAEFDAKGQMARMEQWDDFRYQEGARRATAAKATLDSAANRILLETKARVWDPSGATSADRIALDQASGDFRAEGHVASSQKQDQKRPKSGMLSGEEPVQAIAAGMTSRNRNQLIRYEGDAVVWQAANRIKAESVEIDREARRLVAQGKVETQLLEKGEKGGKTGGLTTVKAAAMVYTESDRLAHYTGGAGMVRQGMRVKSSELRAVLADKDASSSLETAYADGQVEIVQSERDRTRTGSSEHAEYYAGEDKVILRGGSPQLTDTLKGTTHGRELTYFAGDDRLMVNGVPDKPATSRLRRK